MNFMFLQYIANLGETSWKNRVFVRIDLMVAEVHLSSCGEIKFSYHKFLDLRDLRVFQFDDHSNSVMIFDLEESETDPQIMGCPMISSTSSRDANTMFKSAYKSRKLSFLLAEPHTALEAICETLMINTAAAIAATSNGGEGATTTSNFLDMNTVLANHKLDPRPRIYLSESDVKKQFSGAHLTKLFRGVEIDYTVFNIPQGASNYMAPYVAPGVIIPYATEDIPIKGVYQEAGFEGFRHVYRYFNDEYTRLAALKVRTSAQLDSIRMVGVLHQIQEYHVLYGGLLENPAEIESKYTNKYWEWFNDFGYKAKGTFKFQKEESLGTPSMGGKPSLQLCVGRMHFETTVVMNKAAWKLIPDHVYSSTKHNQRLYDFLFVSTYDLKMPKKLQQQQQKQNKEENEKLIVYMVQVTGRPLQDHKFGLSTIRDVFEGLQLLSAETKNNIRKVVFVCVLPHSTKTSNGITVITKTSTGNGRHEDTTNGKWNTNS